MWSVSYVHSVLMDAWFTQHNKGNCSKRNASTSFQSQIYEIKRKRKLYLVSMFVGFFIYCCCFGLIRTEIIKSCVTFQNSWISAIKILVF